MREKQDPMKDFRHKYFKLAYSNLLDVDIAFMLDCTSSMGAYIKEVKQNIKEIVRHVKEQQEGEIRLAFVGYRDHNDGPRRIETLNFTKDVQEFENFVGKIRPHSTGIPDFTEDVFGGLEATLNLKWTHHNQIIFHISDAPQHGSRFHDLSRKNDNFYDVEEPRGLCIERLLACVKSRNLNYYFGRITKHTDKMIQEFEEVGGADIVQTVDMKDPSNMFDEVVNAISRTINRKNSDIIKTKQTRQELLYTDLLM